MPIVVFRAHLYIILIISYIFLDLISYEQMYKQWELLHSIWDSVGHPYTDKTAAFHLKALHILVWMMNIILLDSNAIGANLYLIASHHSWMLLVLLLNDISN